MISWLSGVDIRLGAFDEAELGGLDSFCYYKRYHILQDGFYLGYQKFMAFLVRTAELYGSSGDGES